jgi:nicotinic acid mononucleotide adenylyltransferase
VAEISQPIGFDLDELRRSSHPTLVLRPSPAAPPASVSLLSGSFDPLTVGHAEMARAAAERADLVVLVYSVRTLPKEERAAPALLDEGDRVLALERFCAGHGYTAGLCSHGLLAEQVQAAAERFPGAELSVVIGSDKLMQLFDPRWYDDIESVLGALFDRAWVWFAMRAGDEPAVRDLLAKPEHAQWGVRIRPIEISADVAAVSSRDVRERIARGEDVSDLVPDEFRGLLRTR